jgi:hypothetical protein
MAKRYIAVWNPNCSYPLRCTVLDFLRHTAVMLGLHRCRALTTTRPSIHGLTSLREVFRRPVTGHSYHKGRLQEGPLDFLLPNSIPFELPLGAILETVLAKPRLCAYPVSCLCETAVGADHLATNRHGYVEWPATHRSSGPDFSDSVATKVEGEKSKGEGTAAVWRSWLCESVQFIEPVGRSEPQQ